METVTSAISAQNADKQHVHAAKLLSVYKENAAAIKVLSLDCFDTLLWRKTAAPSDVFYALQAKPSYLANGYSALLRINNEAQIRKKNSLLAGHTEVKLYDIYRASFEAASHYQIVSMMEDELAAEHETCYALPLIIELMRTAKQYGHQLIIVSDTYFNEAQLRDLLAKKLPNDVYESINHVFCSSEFGKSKSGGLFKQVLTTLAMPANAIMHIGDNHHADFLAAQLVGMQSIKLLYGSKDVTDALRLQAISASFLDPSIRNSRPLVNPYRGLIASDESPSEQPENAIGYTTLGPLLYSFANYILREIEQLKTKGIRPKVLFLMRDAYLPSQVCDALFGTRIGCNARISRFAAFAASFRTQATIDDYLIERASSLRFQDMCRQLLLPEELAVKIIAQAESSTNPAREFVNLIHQDEVIKIIITQSSLYRQRLKLYLDNEVALEKGDTVLLVDLGYTGTTQRVLTPIFQDEWGVDVVGRYLLSLRTGANQDKRRGLLDTSTYDDKALVMLVTHIAVLEQLCTANENSVVDYDQAGNPIVSDVSLSTQQHIKLEAIQAECLRFARDAKHFFASTAITLTKNDLRDTAAHYLGRFIFLPTQTELQYLHDFACDFSLGTKEILPLFDLNKGLESLRTRGWLYSSKDNLANKRKHYPAEWRSIGLELALTLMSQHRFELEFALNDLSHRRDKIDVIIVQAHETSAITLDASPTYDGFYALMVPIINNQTQLGIRFGLNYQWVEIDSAEIVKLSSLYSVGEHDHKQDASPYLLLNQMENKSGGLYECLSAAGLLVFAPAQQVVMVGSVLRVIYRPIVRRGNNCDSS